MTFDLAVTSENFSIPDYFIRFERKRERERERELGTWCHFTGKSLPFETLVSNELTIKSLI